MASRTIFLIIYPGQSGQRAHFDIWVPYKESGSTGTVIHVVGTPMAGFALEFKRAYCPTETRRRNRLVPIGSVNSQNVHDYSGDRGADTTPRGNLELVAAQVQPPRASSNFREPVNDVRAELRAHHRHTNGFRLQTVGARSGLWIMSVVLLPSVISMKRP
jgi:hypothetical protein